MKLNNAKEVLQTLLDGRKIKWSTWGKDQYLFMDNGLIVNEKLTQGSYNFNNCSDLMHWEIVKEENSNKDREYLDNLMMENIERYTKI